MNQKPDGKRTDQQAFDETIAPEITTDTDSDGDFATEAMPESLGRYRIEKVLGRGGMGAVYLAHDGQLDRKVALKIPKFGTNTNEKLVARFYREARSAANLSHPNLCPVFDVGEIDGTHYIAMAYIQGRTLSSYVNAEKPPPSKVAASLIRKVAIAMEEAHQSGILHRDLKPANIMVDQRKEPVVMDFGLACPQDTGDDTRLTQDGTLLGSPAYMSPEQLRGQPDAIGKASDVYSLGVVLYELLAGHLPFHGANSTIAMISRILTEEPADIAEVRTDIDPALAAICRKAMSKDVGERFDSMTAFAAALGKYIKSGGGETGKLTEPKAVRAADVSRIQLTEQSRLAKTLCESGQFVAAAPILEQIIANPLGRDAEGQDSKMVQWAKATLPKVQAKIAQATKKKASPSDDFFSDLPATNVQATQHRPIAKATPQKRLVNRGKKGSGSNVLLLIAGTSIAAIALVAGGAFLFFGGSADPASGSGDDGTSTAIATTGPSEPEPKVEPDADPVAEQDPTAPASNDRGRQRRQVGGRESGGKGHATELFGMFDDNQDRFLDENEVPLHERRRMFEGDSNGDGKLSFDEVASLGPPQDGLEPPGPENDRISGRGIPADIMEWDTNQDKRISASEIPQGRRQLMQQADSNGDGFIDKKEAAALKSRIPPRGERGPGGRGPGGRGPGRDDFDGRGDFGGRGGRERPRPTDGPGPGN